MLSQSEALRFEEVFSKFSGKEFSDRIAHEEIQEALTEMKVNPSSEGLQLRLILHEHCQLTRLPSRIEKASR